MPLLRYLTSVLNQLKQGIPTSTNHNIWERIRIMSSGEMMNEPSDKIGDSNVPILSKRARKRLLKRKQYEESKAYKNKKKRQERKERKVDANTIQEEILNETQYYFDNGLRKVHPYHFRFSTYAKERWVNRSLLDVFMDEFRLETKETYIHLIQSGKLRVNGQVATPEYQLKAPDFLENTVHRHELPVGDFSIKVLHEDDGLLVVNKPCSIPVHPCGRYRHNSVIYILAKEHGYRNLRVIHRLDRLTSGLLLLGKTETRTAELMKNIRKMEVSKEYVCRVVGEFPAGEVLCTQPIDVLTKKLGVYKVGEKGKEAKTTFTRLSYDGAQSIVKCAPHTGRTHQIRIHLQWLGFPIVNDPIYNSGLWGPNGGKNGDYGRTEDQLIDDLMAHHSSEKYLADDETKDGNDSSQPFEMHKIRNSRSTEITEQAPGPCKSPVLNSSTQYNDAGHRQSGRNVKPVESGYYESDCLECQRTYVDPKPQDLVMFLHAMTYKGPDWCFTSPLPEWTKEDWSIQKDLK